MNVSSQFDRFCVDLRAHKRQDEQKKDYSFHVHLPYLLIQQHPSDDNFMRDGQDDTVFLGLSCTQELPLFVYPELQVNVDDPLHVAFAGQDTQLPEDR